MRIVLVVISQGLIYKTLRNVNQTTIYYQVGEAGQQKVELCRIEDSIVVKSTIEERNLVRSQQATSMHSGDIQPDMIRVFREKLQRALFYETNVSKPDYNPLFVVKDTTYIFDFLNDNILVFESDGTQDRIIPISYLDDKTRGGQVMIDRLWESFYVSVDYREPNTYYELDNGFDVSNKHEINVTEIGSLQKVIIYKGAAYYMSKEDPNDNLNRLYKQQL